MTSSYKNNVEKFRNKGYTVSQAIELADAIEKEMTVQGKHKKAGKGKITQEAAILETIKGLDNSCTSADVYALMVKDFPEINPKTISATLIKLVRERKIAKVIGYGRGYKRI